MLKAIYTYICDRCRNPFIRDQRMRSDDVEDCPECGARLRLPLASGVRYEEVEADE
jgi:putative FmdB family regulatory protein